MEKKNVELVVNDERLLYTPFSPDDEFNESVKRYIKGKLAGGTHNRSIRLTVISQERLDEERFRRAVSNWINEEKTMLAYKNSDSVRTLAGLLAVGSVLIMLCLALQKHISVLTYSLLPVMGSLSLSRAGALLLIELPTNRAIKWMFNEVELNNDIVFRYTGED